MARKADQQVPKPSRLVEIVAETLEANSEGEFNLPAMLTRYLSGPKATLGLHREFYIPALTTVPYYQSGTDGARLIYMRQAAEVINEIFSGGFPVAHHEFDIPLCKECND